jgi:hypothetical protein
MQQGHLILSLTKDEVNPAPYFDELRIRPSPAIERL